MTKRIAYAPSFGVNSIEYNTEEIKRSLERFDAIALREQEGCNIVRCILDEKKDIVVDPTFLLEKKDWNSIEESIQVPDKYILCYFLSDNIYHWKAVRKFAKSKKMKLVIIPHDGFSYVKSKYVVRNCNVGNFLYLLKNAEYVITDSFHASVFSIIYQKKFMVFERHNPASGNSQNSRIYNLLKLGKCSECLLKYNSTNVQFNDKVNYQNIYDRYKDLINESKKYLNEVLK